MTSVLQLGAGDFHRCDNDHAILSFTAIFSTMPSWNIANRINALIVFCCALMFVLKRSFSCRAAVNKIHTETRSSPRRVLLVTAVLTVAFCDIRCAECNNTPYPCVLGGDTCQYSSCAGPGGGCASGCYNGNCGDFCTYCFNCFNVIGAYYCAPPPLCPPGSWSSDGYNGADGCTGCEYGKYTAETGATACSLCSAAASSCPAGWYLQSNCGGSSAGTCAACPSGSYSSSSGATACSLCSAAASSCSAGWYLLNNCGGSSAGTCAACPSGSYSSSSGATACSLCSAAASSCSAGWYLLNNCGGSSAGTCAACPSGSYSSSSGATACSTCRAAAAAAYCAAGLFLSGCGLASPGACTTCPSGSYSSSSGAFSCTACDAGSYSDVIGASSAASCVECPAGSYSSGSGSSACLTCSAGSYFGLTGAVACTSCGAGSYSNYVGATNSASCIECPPGSYSNTLGASVCLACNAGTYYNLTGATSEISCIKCAAGSYSSGSGASVCTNCSVGSYSGSIGGSSLDSCYTSNMKSEVGAIVGGVLAGCAALFCALYAIWKKAVPFHKDMIYRRVRVHPTQQRGRGAVAGRVVDSEHLESLDPTGPVPGLLEQAIVSLEEAISNLNLKNKRYYLETAQSCVYGRDNVTDDEARALFLYTCQWDLTEESLFYLVNSSLRNRERTTIRPYVPYIRLLISAMSKVSRDPCRTLWRGVAMDLEAIYKAKLGRNVVFWAFTSTTISMDALDTFIPPDSSKRTLFSIKVGSAADLGGFSAYSDEAELLLFPGTVFEVLNVKRISPDVILVELKAVRNLCGQPV